MTRKWLIALATLLASAGTGFAANSTVVLTFQNDISTLDPAIGYNWDNWSMIQAIFDGLMTYKPGTTELQPALATDYQISDDGLTYTFDLRQGVTFTDGEPFDASVVKYSFERMLDPATQSPGVGFFTGIAGAQAFIDGKAKGVSGIEVLSPAKVRFTLTQADATFLNKLALNFSFVVPPKAVAKWGKDFGHHPVGTGGFSMKDWVPGQRLVLVKNPDYFVPSEPKVDEIDFQFGVDPNVAFLRLQRGEVDILGDGVPSSQFAKVMSDPKLKQQVVSSDQIETSFVALNTTMKPFDNVQVRQALNMAIDKSQVLRVINNRAGAADQILPPAMPGYNPDYKGFPYDPAKAKQMLADAGYADGFSSVLYTSNVDPNPRIAQVVQQQLAQIGVKLDIRSLSPSAVIDAASQGKTPMVWSGGMAWLDDYPDPNDFWWPILGCDSAVPGGWNWPRYCNKELDAQGQKADAMVQPSQSDARIALWRDIFTKASNDAPWIPLFNERSYVMHTPRMGGVGFQVAGIYTPVNYKEIEIVGGQ
ncbi:MAG TPA: ABC transporter substrate-binding protein [Trueperaceae bacterium]|nr:ABC transporter substrate-binding protein [Trueperaceae bacterium]